jgi:aryl-alcohol dehydrogenase-like predicted oxidoreductase
MKYNRLGRTGLYVSEICLGTMTYGGKGFWQVIGRLGPDEAAAQLKLAVDAGVNFLDTADVYHEGESERLLGEAIAALGLDRERARDRHQGPRPHRPRPQRRGPVAQAHRRQHRRVLRRLRTDHVDLYQIHGVDPVTPLEETLEALDDVVRAGKVRYVGFCNLPAWRAMKALALSERHGWARFVSAQMFYAVAARDIEREIVPLCEEEGLGILPWSPLAGGLLTGKFHGGERRARGRAPLRSTSRRWTSPAPSPASRPCAPSRRPTACRSRRWRSRGCSTSAT